MTIFAAHMMTRTLSEADIFCSRRYAGSVEVCLRPPQTRTGLSHISCPFVTHSFIFNFQFLIFNSSSHTFSAKEKDSETGLSYFGARYYSSDLSIWLSVDPMSDKYPSFSPYVYCANNPVKLVDPNGEKIKPVNATSKQYLNSYLQDQFGTSNFISYSKNDIVKIDRKAFRTLYANANPYQKVLLNGFKKVVNSRSMVYVDIDNKKKFDYSYPVYTITKDSEFPTYSHDVVGYHIIESGTTVESHDGYFIYINNEGAIADRMISSLPFEDNQSSLSFTGGSASSIFFHELLDEVLNYHIKHKTNDLSRKREKVFYENNALENKGLKPRNGIEHQ